MSLVFPSAFHAPRAPTLQWTASQPMRAVELIPNHQPDASEQADARCYQSCSQEAQRSEAVYLQLQGLLKALPPGNHAHLMATIDGVQFVRSMLRELADMSRDNKDRIPVVLDNLNIVLPCLSRTLQDITKFYENRSLSIENRWRNMYHSMTNEAENLPLPQRFILYTQFVTCLKHLLIRSPDFDFNMLETLRVQIMVLRAARNISPPTRPVGPLVRFDPAESPCINPAVHWSEHIFSLPLPSRRELRSPFMSKSFGPHMPWEYLNLPRDHKTLFRRPFDDDRISLLALLVGPDRIPHLILRVFHQRVPWFSIQTVRDLWVDRDAGALHFKYLDRQERRARPWAILHFKTWEELVLLQSTFVSLKLRGSIKRTLNPEECEIRGEKALIQCRIKDDDFKHGLAVLEDPATGSTRLQAFVWEENLRQCPVWTAFITDKCAHQGWFKRVAQRKIHLYNIRLYVFCRQYRQQSQWVGGEAFEIVFFTQEACDQFEALLDDLSRPRLSHSSPPPEPETEPEQEGEAESASASEHESTQDLYGSGGE